MKLFFAVIATCCALAVGRVSVRPRQEPNLTSGEAWTDPDLGPMPLAWLHIPKTGSSFGNVLLHTPSLCQGVPKDFAIDLDHCPQVKILGKHEMVNLPCPKHNNISTEKECPGLSKWGDHQAVGTLFEKMYRGRGMTMLREPHQRMLSHFEYFLRPFGARLMNYIPKLRGCQVKMIVRSGDKFDYTCASGPPPSDQEVKDAISRLNEFAFVGLSEQWDESVCLFRKMFGGACVGADFINTRPTKQAGRSWLAQQEGEFFFGDHNIGELNGFRDHQDLKLYQAGVHKFNTLRKKYGVNNETCQPCYKNKDIAYTPDQR